MAPHSSTLAWKIPWTEGPGGLQSMGSLGVGQTRLRDFTFTFHFHTLEKEMATHSSVLAWRIPGTGQPGGLPSMGSHRVGHERCSSSNILHNLFIILSFLCVTYVYMISICLLTAASNCETVAWFHNWMKPTVTPINICWMNEFRIFRAFTRAYQWCLTCSENSLRDFPGGGAGEAKTLRSQCKGPGLIPGQGTRSHMS